MRKLILITIFIPIITIGQSKKELKELIVLKSDSIEILIKKLDNNIRKVDDLDNEIKVLKNNVNSQLKIIEDKNDKVLHLNNNITELQESVEKINSYKMSINYVDKVNYNTKRYSFTEITSKYNPNNKYNTEINPLIYVEESGELLTGWLIRERSNKLKLEVYLVDGLWNGIRRFYNENGMLEQETIGVNGKDKVEGYDIYFFKNGNPKQLKSYKNGKKHGVFIGWHKNGQMGSKASYYEGRRNGVVLLWSNSGELISEGLYKDGSFVDVICYNTKGDIVECNDN